MLISFEHSNGDGYIIINHDTKARIHGNDELRDKINYHLKRDGIARYNKFRNNKIPGLIVEKSPINVDNITDLLNSYKAEFSIDNIQYYSEPREYKPKRPTDNNKLRFHDLLFRKEIEKFENYYEYYLIKNYKEKFSGDRCDSIELGDIFIQLIKKRRKKLIVSYRFSKDTFTPEEIVDWLNQYNVEIVHLRQPCIHGAEDIINGVRYNELPIIMYKKGIETIPFNSKEFPEINYSFSKVKVFRINEEKNAEESEIKYKIYFNSKLINYIPEIHLNMERDMLFSNGNFILATYIGDYCDCIGFYAEEGDCLPIAWVHDMNTNVYIDSYKNQDGVGKTVIINSTHKSIK